MRPFSTLGSRYPFGVALSLLLLAAGWFIVPLLLRGPVDATGGTGTLDLTDLRPFIVTEGLLSLGLLLIVALLGWTRATGLRGPVDPAGMRLAGWIVTPACLIIAVSWTGFVMVADGRPFATSLQSIAILSILIGLFEELLFRGVLLHGLRSRVTAGWAIIGSGVLFGLFHAVNAIVGQNLALTAIQMVGATGLGLFFAAITVQARSLWPAIALHALWDAFALSAPVAYQLLPQVDAGAVPQPGPQAMILPAFLALAAWIIHQRWRRRMARDIPPYP
ncbi:CPBP family intramembrane glutamic endopeptidase [Loktanella sp. DJP18]|uniref:CPBP family intramembrane glutamic endopeptidase n=1 Tax=Loktanella sp. DJP18 TaxID=3409788 RepID=UPI003BB569D6